MLLVPAIACMSPPQNYNNWPSIFWQSLGQDPLVGGVAYKYIMTVQRYELSLLEQMTNANVTAEHTGNTVIENTVNSKKTK